MSMARKLRTFDDVIGHQSLISFIKKHIEEDNVSNVIIFHGRPGNGKSSIAKILGIEVVCRYADEGLKETYRRAVIDNNQSTDSIRLFNMSEIQEKEEEIQKVKADLKVGFSSTGRKVLILDEAHNMSKAAQDALLVELEHLDPNVYVFICTTEINALREALKSRSKATFRLNSLTDVEARLVLQKTIKERGLSFDISPSVVIQLISNWANNEPRKMCNLLDNFKDGAHITSRELEVFISVSTAASMIELLKYLYGNMVLGIEYLDGIKYDESFPAMLIEVCKVALGHSTSSLSREDTLYVRDFMSGKDPKHIMRFTAEIAGLSDLRKRRVISAFMRCHVQYQELSKPYTGLSTEAKAMDIKELSTNIETPEVFGSAEESISVPSLDELFGTGDILD